MNLPIDSLNKYIATHSHIQCKLVEVPTASFALYYDWDGTVFTESTYYLRKAQDQAVSVFTKGKMTNIDFPKYLSGKDSLTINNYFAKSISRYVKISGEEFQRLRDKIFIDLVKSHQISKEERLYLDQIINLNINNDYYIPQIIVTASNISRLKAGIKALFGDYHPFDMIVTYDDFYNILDMYPDSKTPEINLTTYLLNLQLGTNYTNQDIIMFEDTYSGVNQALRAGIGQVISINPKVTQLAHLDFKSMYLGLNYLIKNNFLKNSTLFKNRK